MDSAYLVVISTHANLTQRIKPNTLCDPFIMSCTARDNIRFRAVTLLSFWCMLQTAAGAGASMLCSVYLVRFLSHVVHIQLDNIVSVKALVQMGHTRNIP